MLAEDSLLTGFSLVIVIVVIAAVVFLVMRNR